MEVRVLTRRKGEYVFTKDDDGVWTLFRHNRSFYKEFGVVEIRLFHAMKFVAKRFDPRFERVEGFINIKSSWVMHIWVNGKPVRAFTID